MKILTLVSAGMGRPDDETLERDEVLDRSPRLLLFKQKLGSDLLDERFLQSAPAWRRTFYRLVPTHIAQVVEAFLCRRRYDIIISWSEQLGFMLALLLRATRQHVPNIVLSNWISNPNKTKLVKLSHAAVDRILIWSSVQHRYAMDTLRIPESKLVFIRKYADQKFFRPFDCPTDMICAVGMEGRDYRTLIEAMRELPHIPCHIAAGLARGRMFQTVKAIGDGGALPPNITVSFKTYTELRELYARSRFLVIPLLPSMTDHGLTAILEGMAMGKAVICSRTVGQVDVIREGTTGVFVPPMDAGALRDAIASLWDNPLLARKMGAAGRVLLEHHHTLEQFIESIGAVVVDVLQRAGSRTASVRLRRIRSEQQTAVSD